MAGQLVIKVFINLAFGSYMASLVKVNSLLICGSSKERSSHVLDTTVACLQLKVARTSRWLAS